MSPAPTHVLRGTDRQASPEARGDRLMTAAEALDLIARIAVPVTAAEEIPLARAAGRILARDIVSTMDVPPHANAAVDGYAFFHDDLALTGETFLPVTARVAAGMALDRRARRGEAIRIFTGAPRYRSERAAALQHSRSRACVLCLCRSNNPATYPETCRS